MLEVDLFSAFVGHRVVLRPAAGREALGGSPNGADHGNPPLMATVMGTTDRSQLQLETDDLTVLHLNGRAVYAEPTSSATLFRVQGMFEVVAHHPPPAVCILSPFDHLGVLERRQWIRVPTVVPVTMTTGGSSGAERAVIHTVSIDLSGGGIKLSNGPGIKVGSQVTLSVELPVGSAEVDAQVLATGRDGVTRLRFLRMPESVHNRIVRHVFSAQIEIRRRSRNGDS